MLENNLIWKKRFTAVAVILLIILYGIIFWFSSEDAENSSNLSRQVSSFFVNLYHSIFGNGQLQTPQLLAAEAAEGGIRKLAHFMEYLCVGFLSYGIVLCWYQHKWKGRWLVLFQLFVSAALDEFHQYFVPGRNASFKDVLLDTAGGLAGMFLIYGLRSIIRHMKHAVR